MRVSVMSVGKVQVRVDQRFVGVRVAVRSCPLETLVAVLVMFVVNMAVGVYRSFVLVAVFVAFHQM